MNGDWLKNLAWIFCYLTMVPMLPVFICREWSASFTDLTDDTQLLRLGGDVVCTCLRFSGIWSKDLAVLALCCVTWLCAQMLGM